jgi:hypothetical protein
MERNLFFRENVRIPDPREEERHDREIATRRVKSGEIGEEPTGRSLTERRQLRRTLTALGQQLAHLQGDTGKIGHRLAPTVSGALAVADLHASLRREEARQPSIYPTAFAEEAERLSREIAAFRPLMGGMLIHRGGGTPRAVTVARLDSPNRGTVTGNLEDHVEYSG